MKMFIWNIKIHLILFLIWLICTIKQQENYIVILQTACLIHNLLINKLILLFINLHLLKKEIHHLKDIKIIIKHKLVKLSIFLILKLIKKHYQLENKFNFILYHKLKLLKIKEVRKKGLFSKFVSTRHLTKVQIIKEIKTSIQM